MLNASWTFDLIIETVCAYCVSVPVPEEEGEEQDVVMIPHTDEGLELTLDLMGRQIERVLLVGGSGGWSDLFRTFVRKFGRVTVRRGAGTDQGVKFAARQLVFPCSTLAEPSFAPPEGPWARLLELMRADPDPSIGKVADLIEVEIKSPDLPAWRLAAADLGLRDYGATKIGLGPAVEGASLDEEPAEMVGGTFEEPGRAFAIDAATIADALPPEDDEEGDA